MEKATIVFWVWWAMVFLANMTRGSSEKEVRLLTNIVNAIGFVWLIYYVFWP